VITSTTTYKAYSQNRLGRFLSPYPIDGSQPSNSGEEGPSGSSISIAPGSNRGTQSGSSSTTSVISGTTIVTINPGKEIVPNALITSGENLVKDPTNYKLIKDFLEKRNNQPVSYESFSVIIENSDDRSKWSPFEGYGFNASADVLGTMKIYSEGDNWYASLEIMVLPINAGVYPRFTANISSSQNGDPYSFQYVKVENIRFFQDQGILHSSNYQHLGFARIQLPETGVVKVKVYVGSLKYEFFKGNSMTKLYENTFKP
jgi:hypothetical protein